MDVSQKVRYLQSASLYLADAACDMGWTGICLVGSAWLHFSYTRRFPAAKCDLVSGWAIDTYAGQPIGRPYAHYWLECLGTVFDSEVLSRRLGEDGPFYGPTKYHAVRRHGQKIPAIMPEDLPPDGQYLDLGDQSLASLRRTVFVSPAVYLRHGLQQNGTEWADALTDIAHYSGGLLVLPR